MEVSHIIFITILMEPTLYQRRQHSTKIPIQMLYKNDIRRRHSVMIFLFLNLNKQNKKINKAQFQGTVLRVFRKKEKIKKEDVESENMFSVPFL